jgi:hypothetical protein
VAQPFSYSVRQLCYELGLYLNDAVLLTATSTAADTTHFNTTDLANREVGELANSELMPWDVPAGSSLASVRPPQFVVTNDAAGILTLNKAIFSTVYAASNRAVLQNFSGQGHPQVKKEFALKMACMELYDARATTVQTIATPSVTDGWNNLPSTLRSVFRVTAYSAAANAEFEIAPATWQDKIDVAGWRMNLDLAWQGTDEARVYGRLDPTAWWDTLYNVDGTAILANYATTVAGDPARLIKQALPWLLDAKRDDKAAKTVEFAYGRMLREGSSRAYANEVWRT